MTDPTAVCAAAAAQLSAQIPGLITHGGAPGAISVPCAVVIPGIPAVTYGVTMDGEVNMTLRIILLVSPAPDDYGQQALNGYIATSGPNSILAAMSADPTLGGVVEWAELNAVSTYGMIAYAGQEYFGATLTATVGAHL